MSPEDQKIVTDVANALRSIAGDLEQGPLPREGIDDHNQHAAERLRQLADTLIKAAAEQRQRDLRLVRKPRQPRA